MYSARNKKLTLYICSYCCLLASDEFQTGTQEVFLFKEKKKKVIYISPSLMQHQRHTVFTLGKYLYKAKFNTSPFEKHNNTPTYLYIHREKTIQMFAVYA